MFSLKRGKNESEFTLTHIYNCADFPLKKTPFKSLDILVQNSKTSLIIYIPTLTNNSLVEIGVLTIANNILKSGTVVHLKFSVVLLLFLTVHVSFWNGAGQKNCTIKTIDI